MSGIAQVANRVALAFLGSVEQVEVAQAALLSSKSHQLAEVAKALTGVAPVSEVSWTADYKVVIAKALADAKGADGQPRYAAGSINPKLSALKVVVMGITNGVVPLEGEMIKAYEDRARQQMTREEIYTPSSSGAKKDGRARKQEQVAYQDACLCVALKDENRARLLGLTMSSPISRKALDAWFAANVGELPEGEGELEVAA